MNEPPKPPDTGGLRRGSDPRIQTCRGKLQLQRSKLNLEINKQLMLRTGAEKLYRVTADKKLKETIALELRYFNSNIQLLKEELSDLNSSIDVYQNKDGCQSLPMIPLGLKETVDVDFRESFKDFILEHYSEEANKYDDAITELMDLRQAMKTPKRDDSGITLMFNYYGQLYYVERRFFPPDRVLGVHFEWYDSFTGVPSIQKTIAFEKANVLFNIAALYTQIGTRRDRMKSAELDASIDSFLRAASLFNYIRTNFSNAPSLDLQSEALEMLTNIMLAQARECIFEKSICKSSKSKHIESCLEMGQEAAQVADAYDKVHRIMLEPPVKGYVPSTWISFATVKAKYYLAFSHYYVALALLDYGDLNQTVLDVLDCIQIVDHDKSTLIDIKVPKTDEERLLLGMSHLKMSLMLHEETLLDNSIWRQRRKLDFLQERLKSARNTVLKKYNDTEEEDDFRDVFDPPKIQASTKYQLTLTVPDFSLYKVKDLFSGLGPIAIFSSRHHWTAPRNVNLQKSAHQSFGLSLRGDSPVIIAGVDLDSIAEVAGVKEGDFIVAVNGVDTKWHKHSEMVSLIKASGNNLEIRLVTPMDRNYLRPCRSPASIPHQHSLSSTFSKSVTPAYLERTNMTGSFSSTKSKEGSKKFTWNPFRRAASSKARNSLACSSFSHHSIYASVVS